jgi:hypothetical protein
MYTLFVIQGYSTQKKHDLMSWMNVFREVKACEPDCGKATGSTCAQS